MEKYKRTLEFLLVCIRDAHPTDRQAFTNARDALKISEAKNFWQKEEHATSRVRNLDIKLSVAVEHGCEMELDST